MNTRKSYRGEAPDEGWPVDHLSAHQIEKGAEILQEIETTLKHKSGKSKLVELTNNYYTVIPHKFSREHTPPVIDSMDLLAQEKNKLQDALAHQS